ncbi:CpsD/CapB family tyrosine-protein kinase [Amaricoccus solimangrovi]|uniref:CpsD/CapB family tyrosine-protein kinase n=1 Tax=Amaricoccus solimangrovi TaxID=2589815 RepID=A0A501WF87_9RHOB|nr:CpsD/CapB family tyrosine-protein kinase [Amaricoccus solimangrovi]TPE48523.1 CpsD/CapB family tyrosine-protein kinase [Amaricoccus solimangrovi]
MTMMERGLAGGTAPGSEAAWAALAEAVLEPRRLARNRIVAGGRSDPAHVPFDLLRTRMLRALRERGWRRVGITSASPGCGKTFVTANLALSVARRESCRVIALDLDLRIPSLAKALGQRGSARIEDLLAGRTAPADHLRRVGPNLALGLNAAPVGNPAELLEEPGTAAALARIEAGFAPDVILCDLPPALACDDVLAILPRLDALLLVAGAGITTPTQIRSCEKLFGETPLLGVILNRAEDGPVEPYYA